MFSDSIQKGIRIHEFNRYITNATARLKMFPGTTSKELTHYVVPTLQEESFSSALINIGINDILKDQTTYSVSHSLEIFWKYHNNVKNMEIIISSLVVTENIDLNLLACVNASLCNMCRENVFFFR